MITKHLSRVERGLTAAVSALTLCMIAAPAVLHAQTPTTPVQSRAGPLDVQRLVALDNPWGMAWLPDGGLLVTEKPGRLRVWRAGALSAPLSGVPTVAYRGQGGLLDVEVDPRFSGNRYIYLAYAEPGERRPGGRDTPDGRLGPFQDLDDADDKGLAVARARLDGSTLRDVTVIWRAPKTGGRGHFGGRLAFAPDGALLLTSGDRQRFEPAQDRASGLGKVIRIRTDGTVLPDNPFANGPQGARPAWTFGHRNPLGIAVRPGTSEVWVSEMGPEGGDEINRLQPGANYGWPLVSPGDNYDATPLPRPVTRPELTPALHSFNPAISPSSLAFYTGDLFPAWRGHLLIGGLSSQALVRGVPAEDGVHDLEAIRIGFRVRDVSTAPDGSVLLLRDGDDGGLYRITPATTRP